MNWILIGIIIILSIILIILFRKQKVIYTANKKIEQYNAKLDRDCSAKSQQLQELQTEYENKLKEYADTLIDTANDYSNKLKEIEMRKQKAEDDYETWREMKENRLYNNLSNFYAERYDEVTQEVREEKDKITQELVTLRAEQQNLNQEIDSLSSSRDALIETYKREEQESSQKQFYSIIIPENDMQDIEVLKQVEPLLYNKEVLYKLIWSNYYMKPLKELLGRIVGQNKVSGIYKITNQLNHKVYIGQSVDVANRITEHIKASLGISTISHQKIHEALKQDGISNFTFELVETCEKTQLNTKEKFWIKTCQSDTYGYNLTAGGA